MNLRTLVDRIVGEGLLPLALNNPATQFGQSNVSRVLIGATLLPEREVPTNSYTETGIRYRSFVANDNTRYSPPVPRGGSIIGNFNVELANSDTAAEFTANDADALNRLFGANRTDEAYVQFTRWADAHLVRPLQDNNERMRWEAIVNGQVNLIGANGYAETVTYSQPSGHRVTVASGTVGSPTGWYKTDTSYDPFTDIFAGVAKLESKGFVVDRIIMSRALAMAMANNGSVKLRTNRAAFTTAGSVVAVGGRSTLADINQALNADGLPNIEIYDATYDTEGGVKRFLPATACVLIGRTGDNVDIRLTPTRFEPLQNTLGYLGVGTPVGRTTPGRQEYIESFNDKPPRIVAQAWQTTLPVVLHPEAIYVINVPNPT